MDFLNKLYTKAIFSDAEELNVDAYDLGEDMISGTLDEPPVARINVACGTIGSLAVYVPCSVNINILKTSPSISEYYERLLSNGYIGGTLTLYDDTNQAFTIKDVSLVLNEIPSANGTNAAVTFVLQGNLAVNKDSLSI